MLAHDFDVIAMVTTERHFRLEMINEVLLVLS